MRHSIYLYVFDSMSDWEIGYLTAELHSGRYFKKGLEPFNVVTVALEKKPIKTMGGLTIMPDEQLSACDPENMAALILPGGETWMKTVHEPIYCWVQHALEQGKVVGAICGATMGLAQAGFLETYEHTSNDLEYLKMVCPAYQGQLLYKMSPAVTDRKLITASGIAPLDFSAAVIDALGVFSKETLEAWYALNKTQNPQYFYELMQAIS